MNPSLTDSRRQALRSASHWYAVLSGERVSPQQEARWQQWYEQDQDNQWAWQQVENLRNQLGGVPGDVASRALHDTRLTRRHVMKGLLLLLGAGGGWQLWQSETGEGLRADYRTPKGAVSRQQLEDGSLPKARRMCVLMRISAPSGSGTVKSPLLPRKMRSNAPSAS